MYESFGESKKWLLCVSRITKEFHYAECDCPVECKNGKKISNFTKKNYFVQKNLKFCQIRMVN